MGSMGGLRRQSRERALAGALAACRHTSRFRVIRFRWSRLQSWRFLDQGWDPAEGFLEFVDKLQNATPEEAEGWVRGEEESTDS